MVRGRNRQCSWWRVFQRPTAKNRGTWRSVVSVTSFITLVCAKRQCPFGEKDHFYWDVISHVNYNGHSSVLTRHSFRKIKMKGIPQLSGPVSIDVPVAGGSGKNRNQIIWAEQKCVNWMEEAVHKISKPDELVPTSFPATSATAKKCPDLT